MTHFFQRHTSRRSGGLTPVVLSSMLILGLVAAVTGCGEGRAHEIGRLQNAFASPEDLGRAAVAALRERDRAALESYLVTHAEHRDLLWDQLPERNYFRFEYARLLNERNTSKAIRRALERYGGLPLQFTGIRFRDEPEIYDDFVLHRGAELGVRHRETGEEGTITLLNVVLELDRGWKPLHYVE